MTPVGFVQLDTLPLVNKPKWLMSGVSEVLFT